MKWNEVRKQFEVLSEKALAGVLAAALAATGLAGCGAAQTAAGAVGEKTDGQEMQDAGDNAENGGAMTALLDTIQENTNQSNEEQGKEETVYIFADSKGSMTSAVVSGWLKNPEGLEVLTDRTDAADIINVKGDEAYTKEGSQYRWEANGGDIYYQGTTTKEAPVTVKITYYLDGKEISADALAGKSGRVTMRFDYQNAQTVTTQINGAEEEIAVPFAVVTGMILNERFRNISVENGKLVSDGKNNLVIGFALPGLQESLKLDEIGTAETDDSIIVPDHVEVTADVEDFELDMTLTVAAASADLSFDKALDFSDLDEKIDTLTDSSAQLADGTRALTEGILTLKDSLGAFVDGAAELKDGIDAYTDGAGALADGIFEIKDGADSLDEGAGSLVDGVNILQAGANALKDGIDSAADGASKLQDGIDSASGGAGELRKGIASAADGALALKEGIASAASGASALQEGMKSVENGVDQLEEGINGTAGARIGAAQLAAGAKALKEGFDGTENDPENPGAVLAAKQIALGIRQLAAAVETGTQQQIGAIEKQLLNAETVYVQKLYEAAGQSVVIDQSNVRAYAQNLDSLTAGISENVQTRAGIAISALLDSAVGEAAEDAAANAKAEAYVKGYEDGRLDAETEKASELSQGYQNAETADAEPDDENDSQEADEAGRNGDKAAEETVKTEDDGRQEDEENGGNSAEEEKTGEAKTGNEDAEEADYSGSDSCEETQDSLMEAAYFAKGTERQYGVISLKNREEKDGSMILLTGAKDSSQADETGSASADISVQTADILREASETLMEVGNAQGAVMAIEQMLDQLENAGASLPEEQLAQIRQLVEGANALAEGLDQLSEGADQLCDGASKLSEGMAALGNGAAALTDGVDALFAGSSELTDGMGKLSVGSSELTAGMGKLSAGSSELTAGMEKLFAGSDELTDGMGKLKDGGSELADGVGELYGGSGALKDGTQRLKDGTGELWNGAAELTDNSDALKDGAGELAEGSLKVADGVDELYGGAGELLDGMLEFDEKGIQKIAEIYNGDLKSFCDRVRAISDAGSGYDNFCGKEENTKSSVKFVIRTDAIKK